MSVGAFQPLVNSCALGRIGRSMTESLPFATQRPLAPLRPFHPTSPGEPA